MTAEFVAAVTSIASNALLLSSTVQVLERVEALPLGATGALAFGEDGLILVQNRRVCWAVARDMEQRLTDLLCEQTVPRIPRVVLEQVFRRCKREGRPFGEELVSSGTLGESALRAALIAHTCEAILRLAQRVERAPVRFSRHQRQGYDPRFVFTTSELLASLAGKRRAQLASFAREHLATVLVPGACGIACVRDPRSKKPVLIAVGNGCELEVSAALSVAAWAASALDIAAYADPDARVLSGTWCDRMTVVAWRRREILYAALCTERPASARLLKALPERLALEPDAKGERA